LIYSENDTWYLKEFDYVERIWTKLLPFRPSIPALDPNLFKNLYIVGYKSLIFVNVGKISEAKKLCICNNLIGKTSKQLWIVSYASPT
jgi:hypothetical protein